MPPIAGLVAPRASAYLRGVAAPSNSAATGGTAAGKTRIGITRDNGRCGVAVAIQVARLQPDLRGSDGL